uniref:Chaperonin 10 n=1 Tax=Emiliania huxleyi TaxID=2903 RepID=A0A7S3RER4_EMIHU
MAPIIAALCLSFVLPLPLDTARHARGATPAPALMEAAATTYRLNNYLLPAPLTPRNNMVLVKLRKSEEGETSRGLVLAASQRKIRDGEVAAAGPGLTHPESGQLLPTGVGAGDHVLCEEIVMEGEAIDYLGEKHRMLPDSRVVATLEGGVMSAATFKPSGERLLVRLPKAVEETASGIALAGLGDSGELPSQGEVVAVGPGQLNARGEHNPMPVAPGEFVVFGRYAGSELDFEDGFKYKVVFARECLAKW